MIRRKKDDGIVIDLDGPDGNVFILLGYAKRFMNQIDPSKTDDVLKEMKSDDYINAVKVFEREFGSIITLETNQEELLKIIS